MATLVNDKFKFKLFKLCGLQGFTIDDNIAYFFRAALNKVGQNSQVFSIQI